MASRKIIEAIRKIRKRAEKHYDLQQFCKYHNMKLDEINHYEIEQELRRVCQELENEFETGYISPNK